MPLLRLASLLLALLAAAPLRAGEVAGWPVTEGAPGGGRYSPLADIRADNVASLREVWRYRHGDFFAGRFPVEGQTGSAFESTPIVMDRRLVFTTPTNRVIALDAETGRELWSFDPKLDRGAAYANMWINRGVAAWRAPDGAGAGACATRLFLATLDARLFALDASTGAPCTGFGEAGAVNLLAGLAPVADPWEYGVTSPPTVVGDVVVVGSSIADLLRPNAPPGDVRGFDARTGALRWTFHTIPHAGEPGAETWEQGAALSGAANVWSTITADLARGLVFLPVSTATDDHYGGDRLGANLYSDAVVALDAATGAVRRHFQTVHHDLLDYDLAAPPVLVTLRRDGREVDAVVQATKAGLLFVLDRETGVPLFPVEERPVPASDVPGERAWPTQPFPVKPPPLTSHRLTEDDLYAPTPEHKSACAKQLEGFRNEGIFTPPSERGSVLHPFTGGGVNWSGVAWDPGRRVLVVPVNNLVHLVKLRKVSDEGVGNGLAQPLHGLTLRGLWWVLTGRGTGLRYQVHPWNGRVLFAQDGIPCNAPPWGRLAGVDLDRGEIVWSVSTSAGEGDPGLAGYGPPLVTASGLAFHAGTHDPVLRIYDTASGKRVGTLALPAGLHAGPISYRLREDGPQLLVLAPGGHSDIGSPLGDYVIAYALP
jgi:quinoprotein glucose dehydrogenase